MLHFSKHPEGLVAAAPVYLNRCRFVAKIQSLLHLVDPGRNSGRNATPGSQKFPVCVIGHNLITCKLIHTVAFPVPSTKNSTFRHFLCTDFLVAKRRLCNACVTSLPVTWKITPSQPKSNPKTSSSLKEGFLK
jgi:hypothetical protein